MFLRSRHYKTIDLTGAYRGTRALTELGFTNSTASPGWYYDGSVYRQAAANAFRFSSEGGRTGLLCESADENKALYSSENNAAWTTSNVTKSAEGNSIISGKTPIKCTATAAGGWIGQTVGTTSADCYSIIVEQGNSTVADIELYDGTGGSVSIVRLTFSTGVVSQVSGASTKIGAYRITPSGPNGGATWLLHLTATGGGGTRTIRFYPDSATGNKYSYLHHSQLSTDHTHPLSPIVTTNAAVSRTADVVSTSTIPSWWNDSQITVYATAERMITIDEQGCIFVATNGGLTDYTLCTMDGTTGTNEARITVSIGGVTVDVSTLTPSPPGSKQRYAFSAKNGATYAAGSGGASANANQVGAPATPEVLSIGQAAGSIYFLEGRVYSISIRQTAHDTSALESWTS